MNRIYKLLAFFAICFMAFNVAVGQTPGTGKPIGEIFADFHQKLDESTDIRTGFDINRAYVGYSYTLDNNFSVTIVADAAGRPNSIGGTSGRFASLRYAYVGWSKEKLAISFGSTDTRIYFHQQRWWGKRYLAVPIQSLHGHGVVTDLGLVVDYKFSDVFSGDITVMNGEGYNVAQLDDNVKTSLGFTVTPDDRFIFRVYGDHYRVQNDRTDSLIMGKNQFTGVVFAGYKNKYFYVGAEATFKTNVDEVSGTDSWGISTTNGIYLSEKSELFFRYDYFRSNGRWDTRDGTFTIIGLQHTVSSNLKFTLNYQGTYNYFNSVANRNLIYLNAHFRF